MLSTVQKLGEKLTFIPFVMINGMNFFPIFILSQLFINHEKINRFILPLVMFYCFKTTILFIFRIKEIDSFKLLKFSILVGIIGSFIGFLSHRHFYLQIFSGIFLGISSGLLTPAHLTVKLHEKKYNHLKTAPKDLAYSLLFAVVLIFGLFKASNHSLMSTFLFLMFNLILLYIIISAYPTYQIMDNTPYPNYSISESLLLFSLGFFTIFILKSSKKIGFTSFLLPMILLFISVSLIYIFYLKKVKPKRKFNKLATTIIIYKGMLTNFIFVFCTFFMLISRGKRAFYIVYLLYLIATIIGPTLNVLLKKKTRFSQGNTLIIGLSLSFFLILFDWTFYTGVFLLSLFAQYLNQDLTQFAYKQNGIPQDNRIMAKFRLNNIGSIIHQVMMVAILFLVTKLAGVSNLAEIYLDYSTQTIDLNTLLPLQLTKIFILIIFILFFHNLNVFYRQYFINETIDDLSMDN